MVSDNLRQYLLKMAEGTGAQAGSAQVDKTDSAGGAAGQSQQDSVPTGTRYRATRLTKTLRPFVRGGAKGVAIGGGVAAMAAMVADLIEAHRQMKKDKKRKSTMPSEDTVVFHVRKPSAKMAEENIGIDQSGPCESAPKMPESTRTSEVVASTADSKPRGSDGKFSTLFKSAQLDLTGIPRDAAMIAGAVAGVPLGYAIVDKIAAKLEENRLKKQIAAAQQEYIDMVGGGVKTAGAFGRMLLFDRFNEKTAGEGQYRSGGSKSGSKSKPAAGSTSHDDHVETVDPVVTDRGSIVARGVSAISASLRGKYPGTIDENSDIGRRIRNGESVELPVPGQTGDAGPWTTPNGEGSPGLGTRFIDAVGKVPEKIDVNITAPVKQMGSDLLQGGWDKVVELYNAIRDNPNAQLLGRMAHGAGSGALAALLLATGASAYITHRLLKKRFDKPDSDDEPKKVTRILFKQGSYEHGMTPEEFVCTLEVFRDYIRDSDPRLEKNAAVQYYTWKDDDPKDNFYRAVYGAAVKGAGEQEGFMQALFDEAMKERGIGQGATGNWGAVLGNLRSMAARGGSSGSDAEAKIKQLLVEYIRENPDAWFSLLADPRNKVAVKELLNQHIAGIQKGGGILGTLMSIPGIGDLIKGVMRWYGMNTQDGRARFLKGFGQEVGMSDDVIKPFMTKSDYVLYGGHPSVSSNTVEQQGQAGIGAVGPETSDTESTTAHGTTENAPAAAAAPSGESAATAGPADTPAVVGATGQQPAATEPTATSAQSPDRPPPPATGPSAMLRHPAQPWGQFHA